MHIMVTGGTSGIGLEAAQVRVSSRKGGRLWPRSASCSARHPPPTPPRPRTPPPCAHARCCARGGPTCTLWVPTWTRVEGKHKHVRARRVPHPPDHHTTPARLPAHPVARAARCRGCRSACLAPRLTTFSATSPRSREAERAGGGGGGGALGGAPACSRALHACRVPHPLVPPFHPASAQLGAQPGARLPRAGPPPPRAGAQRRHLPQLLQAVRWAGGWGGWVGAPLLRGGYIAALTCTRPCAPRTTPTTLSLPLCLPGPPRV